MYQPRPSTGQPAGSPRPSARAPVRTAVKLMYAGAGVTAAWLITGLALIIADIQVAARGQFLGQSLTSPQAKPFVITVWIVAGLPLESIVRASGVTDHRGDLLCPRPGEATCPVMISR